jgi:hypothetical protein
LIDRSIETKETKERIKKNASRRSGKRELHVAGSWRKKKTMDQKFHAGATATLTPGTHLLDQTRWGVAVNREALTL